MEEEILIGKTLLIVDDEVDLRDIISSEMEFMGAKVFQAGNIAAAKEILSKEQVDLIVSDIRMPGGTGIDLLDYVKAKDPMIPPVVLITGFADISAEDAFNKGAEALLNKPFKLEELARIVTKNTLKPDERFNSTDSRATQSLNVNFNKTLNEAIEAKQVLFGRGGVALGLEGQKKKIEIGETVELSLNFTDVKLTGIGVCRWSKVLDRVYVGMEFVALNAESLQFILPLWGEGQIKSYIPAY